MDKALIEVFEMPLSDDSKVYDVQILRQISFECETEKQARALARKLRALLNNDTFAYCTAYPASQINKKVVY